MRAIIGNRVPAIPESFDGLSVLDIGTFDGFYAFLAEAREAGRVVAVDNEQYIDWVRDRWDVHLEGGEGFRAIHRLLDSSVEYRKLDALELDVLWGELRLHLLLRDPAPRRGSRQVAGGPEPPALRGRSGADRDPRRLRGP